MLDNFSHEGSASPLFLIINRFILRCLEFEVIIVSEFRVFASNCNERKNYLISLMAICVLHRLNIIFTL